MIKKVKAVMPYIYKGGTNFKDKPYNAWMQTAGASAIASSKYPPRYLHKLAFEWSLPSLYKSRKEARLRFVQASQLNFDTFPDYAFYEIIPFVWDCWPRFDEQVVRWFLKHDVKACIFTSSEAAERIKMQIPTINILVITEGIDVENYPEGKQLQERQLDFYLFGRNPSKLWKKGDFDDISFMWGGDNITFKESIKNAKVTLAFPRCYVEPEQTGGQETLTQRYWECMLSRMVMIGRAPKEIIDLIGYNPVIDADTKDLSKQVHNIISNISDYQSLVDKNRETALRMAPWEIRMNQVMEWLKSIGYEI